MLLFSPVKAYHTVLYLCPGNIRLYSLMKHLRPFITGTEIPSLSLPLCSTLWYLTWDRFVFILIVISRSMRMASSAFTGRKTPINFVPWCLQYNLFECMRLVTLNCVAFSVLFRTRISCWFIPRQECVTVISKLKKLISRNCISMRSN